jgi:hypothetical protein
VISAIVDVEQAGLGARGLQVEADDDWLTASEIAARSQSGAAHDVLYRPPCPQFGTKRSCQPWHFLA